MGLQWRSQDLVVVGALGVGVTKNWWKEGLYEQLPGSVWEIRYLSAVEQMGLSLLKGRALGVYSLLLADQANNYDGLKYALLKRYQLSADGFKRWLRFRTTSYLDRGGK